MRINPLKLPASSMLAALLMLAAPSSSAEELVGVQRIAPREIKDFELTDQSGQARKFSSFKGAPVLVFFGFTSCPDICPAVMQQFKALKQSKDPAVQRVQMVMISVDGTRDTPAAMQAYLEPLSKKFVGLTGPPLKVRDIAAQFAAVFFKGAADKKGAYRVDHTSQIYLIDAAGKLRASFADASLESMRLVTGEISRTPAL